MDGSERLGLMCQIARNNCSLEILPEYVSLFDSKSKIGIDEEMIIDWSGYRTSTGVKFPNAREIQNMIFSCLADSRRFGCPFGK
jgi:hypothetical protein